MRGLILGAGEVGRGLHEVLAEVYPCQLHDLNPPELEDVEILHICFPYGPSFVESVLEYKRRYQPRYTVIHSTVAPGTSDACGATHSPIRGDHLKMAESIRTFTKFVGGKDADVVALYFYRAGITVAVCRDSRTTEIGKLLCTTFYGVCIEYTKAAERLCLEAGVPFAEAFTLFQQTYNDGYRRLGRENVQRPVLSPIQAPIGGHCVLPNCELFAFPFAEIVKKVGS